MEQIKLDIVPAGVASVAHASQFDNGRQIRFNLFNQGTPYTLTGAETVTMVVNGEEENITNTSDNYVIWDVAEEDCEEVGVIGCEIRIVLGSMLIGSKNFFLEVEMDPYDGKNVHVVTVGPADICTFETTLPEPLSVLVDVVASQASGTPTPSTPLPITGYSSANITRCGVNLYDNDFSHYRKPVNYYIKNVPLEAGKVYTLKATLKDGGTAVSGCYFGVASKGEQYSEFLPDLYPCIKTDGTTATSTLTVTSAWTSPKLCCYVASETQFNSIMENYDILLTEGTADFEPYNGQTYTVSFGQTVYGGQLDVTRGKLHVDMYLFTTDFTGASDIGGGFYRKSVAIPYNAVYPAVKPQLCNVAPHQASYAGQFTHFYCNLDTAIIVLPDDTPASTEIEILYELATPIDIDLTPEVISAIVGTNNVFANCGQTTVKYLKAGA